MYAVGRLGSYITQGVYTVSGPFHPFGGAVDIVVVQQQDGSLKSSPWYIKFGKFQGVLKAKERVVDINVNGVDADFHMYLDPRGEAYFLREVDSEEIVDAVSSRSSSFEEIDGKTHDKIPAKSKSMNYDFDRCDSVSDVSNGKVLSRTNSKRSRILGFVLGRRSMQEHSLSKEDNDSNVDRIASMEHAEIAADLLEMKWSTNLSSRNNTNNCKEFIKDSNGESIGGRLDATLVLHEQHFVNKLEKSGVDDEMPATEVHETCVEDVGNEEVDKEHNTSVENCVSEVESSRTQLDDCNEAEVGIITAEEPSKIAEKICTEVAATQQGDASIEVVCLNEDDKSTTQLDEANEIRLPLESNGEFQDVSGDSLLIKQVPEGFVEEQLIFGELDSKPSINSTERTQSVSTSEVDEACSESLSLKHGPYPPPLPVRIRQERFKGDIEGQKGNIRRSPSHADIPRNCEVAEKGVGRQAKSLPNLWSPFDDPNSQNEDSEFYSPAAKFRSSNWDLIREDIKKSNSEKELRLSDSHNADTLSKDLKDGSIASDGSSDIVDGSGGSWNLWPFRRLGSKNVSQKEQNSKKDSDVETAMETDGEKEASSPKSNKMHTRALAPTPDQLASLNLAEGKNTVTFTFSTSVLGAQKVDARIYLWRWDTRIVISDVDGTITKSDVLGQFMPLVGRDWSHIGVTHLFSAIKNRLLEEGISEVLIKDCEQIMLLEFSEIQGQVELLCQERSNLLDTLRQLEVQGFVEDASGKKHATVFGKWDESMYYINGIATVKPKDMGDANLLWQRTLPPTNLTRYNLTYFAITLNELTPGLLRVKEKLPPTDSRLGPDQRHLDKGEYDMANVEKLRLETRQRMSRKLQENGWKPRWFQKDGEDSTFRYI